MRKLIPILPLLAALWACGGESAPAPEAEAPSAAAAADPAAPSAPEATAEGEDVGMISSRGERVPAAPAGGGTGEESPLRFDLPAGWQAEPVGSPMRLAQAVIPGPGGPGQLAVFYFGAGQGGGVEANFERWAGQMNTEPGTEAERGTFAANGLQVTWMDIAGTLQPSSMGTGPATAQPGSRLLGAVVEGPAGPWFFKATGPDSTIAAAREPFLAMLRGARLP